MARQTATNLTHMASMETNVLDKTDKGRREIAQRTYRLPVRLRALLLLVDGKKTGAALLSQIAGIGLGIEHLTQLQEQGFVRNASERGASAESSAKGVATEVQTGEGAFEALYHFYSDTIKCNIGLHGYALQLLVEKAPDIAALTALREPYLTAVRQAKGNDTARSLADQLDALLDHRSTPHNRATREPG